MIFWFILLNIFLYINANPISDEWQLHIVHTNDMHSRFEEVSALSTRCLPSYAESGKCYGGFARIATLVRKAKNSTIPTLFLNAGDTYQGTVYYTVHKWRIVSKFLNLLKPDAISLGNHEFDDGPEGLVPFINAAEFPIVTSNLDLTGEPELAAATKLSNSTVITVDGRRVGIIGYLTPETKVISSPGKVVFLDEVETVRREVNKLQADNVTIIIALGHSGFGADKKIAAEVDGVDLVIGGHTNTFLYSGRKPDLEVPEGLYPTEVIQKNGRKVYVVQAYAYTKYLGNLSITFDAAGEIRSILGNPILVTSDIEQAPDILQELEVWKKATDNFTRIEVGYSKVLLDGNEKNCRRRECNLGNVIVDAMIDYNTREFPSIDGWTDAAVAIHNSGSVRTSINKSPNTPITVSDILAVLPFNNAIGKINMTGKQIITMLEHSVHSLEFNDTSNLNGGFLHFSGLQVVYDLFKPSGNRVVHDSVLIRCSKCRIPQYNKLEENSTYTLIVPDFIAQGGDGYDMLQNLTYAPFGVTTDQILTDYIKRRSPLHAGVEWRISFLESNDNHKNSANNIYLQKIFVLPLLSILIFLR
ncbi:protein 5NUC-like [Microplitis mediator]|uniref:protein 5NUC-like n=1 Tax=Microplitis mediator TaxID=375433 RepID=UPI002554467C|nr:protein 5NUC-like [Microplitis mediator]